MAGYDDTGDYTRMSNDAGELLGGAKGLLVKFFKGTIKDDIESAKAGYPKHKTIEMVRIITPGDRDNIVEREVLPIDIQRFSRIYENWKTKGDGADDVDGMPLSAWPTMDAAMVEDLKYWKIYTVEQLAELQDSVMQKIGPLHELRAKAKTFLLAAKDNAVLERFQSDAKEKDAKIKSLEQMVSQLNDKLEDMMTRSEGKRAKL